MVSGLGGRVHLLNWKSSEEESYSVLHASGECMCLSHGDICISDLIYSVWWMVVLCNHVSRKYVVTHAITTPIFRSH